MAIAVLDLTIRGAVMPRSGITGAVRAFATTRHNERGGRATTTRAVAPGRGDPGGRDDDTEGHSGQNEEGTPGTQ